MQAKKKIVLFDIDYTLFDTHAFRRSDLRDYKSYQEVVSLLSQIAKIAKLGIFSEGDQSFQRKKLIKTNLLKHFSKKHIHVVTSKEDKVKEILKKYKNMRLFVIDDKLPVLKDAKDFDSSIFTIWVKRGMYAEKQKPIKGFRPDAEVENLKTIVSMIESA